MKPAVTPTANDAAPTITVVSGGVGAARFLRGLIDAVDEANSITAIVNTADDCVMHGLSISPDLDTVTYTLADAIDPVRGWGLVDESWRVMESLAPVRSGQASGFGGRHTVVQPRRSRSGDAPLPDRATSGGREPDDRHRRDQAGVARPDPHPAHVRRGAVDTCQHGRSR